MPSDDLFPETGSPDPWEGLEKRVSRLLEGIVQLRNANAQLMKDNSLLKNQLKESAGGGNGDSPELAELQAKYEEALQDLRQAKSNLQRLEELAAELKQGS